MKSTEEYTKEIYTPRELCKTCWEWIDNDENDYPHCSANNIHETHQYLHHRQENCKEYFEE